MATTECPVGGCDFTDTIKSVEAHISGNPSGGHSGKVGREFRDQLVDQVESELNGEANDVLLGLTPGQIVLGLVAVAAVLYLATNGDPESLDVTEDDYQEEEPTFGVENGA